MVSACWFLAFTVLAFYGLRFMVQGFTVLGAGFKVAGCGLRVLGVGLQHVQTQEMSTTFLVEMSVNKMFCTDQLLISTTTINGPICEGQCVACCLTGRMERASFFFFITLKPRVE